MNSKHIMRTVISYSDFEQKGEASSKQLEHMSTFLPAKYAHNILLKKVIKV